MQGADCWHLAKGRDHLDRILSPGFGDPGIQGSRDPGIQGSRIQDPPGSRDLVAVALTPYGTQSEKEEGAH